MTRYMGGGLWLSSTTSGTFVNLTVTGNTAHSTAYGEGAGIVTYAQTARFTNLLVADNIGATCSAMANMGNARLENATVAGNVYGKYETDHILCLRGPTQIYNTIVWGNEEVIIFLAAGTAVVPHRSEPKGFPEMTLEPGAAAGVIIANSLLEDGCPAGAICTDLVSGDPLFVDPGNQNYRLKWYSPAVNTGRNDVLPLDLYDLDGNGDPWEILPIDLDGSTRILQNRVDLGAYELQVQADAVQYQYLPILHR